MNSKILFFSVSICILFAISSCKTNTPKAVAESFLLNVAKGNLDEAKKYADQNTQELLEQASDLSSLPDSVKDVGKNLKINIQSVKENGDKAVVTYTTSKLDQSQIISLIKIDGEWKVQLDKMQEMEEEMVIPELNELMHEDSSTNAGRIIDSNSN